MDQVSPTRNHGTTPVNAATGCPSPQKAARTSAPSLPVAENQMGLNNVFIKKRLGNSAWNALDCSNATAKSCGQPQL